VSNGTPARIDISNGSIKFGPQIVLIYSIKDCNINKTQDKKDGTKAIFIVSSFLAVFLLALLIGDYLENAVAAILSLGAGVALIAANIESAQEELYDIILQTNVSSDTILRGATTDFAENIQKLIRRFIKNKHIIKDNLDDIQIDTKVKQIIIVRVGA
jgi:hypothetical protein